MEHELGVALFERRPRGVVLTDLGRVFLRRAATIQNELRLATDEIAQMRGHSTGQVSVYLSSAVQMALFPRVLEPFRKRFGDVYLTVSEAAFPVIEAKLLEGEFDFYAGPLADHIPSPELLVEKLFDNTRLVFGRKGHPKANARTLRDLVDTRWIRTLIAVDKSAEIAHVFAQHGLKEPIVEMTAGSTIGVILAAASTDLLTMLPKQWLEFESARQTLDPIHIEETLAAPPIFLVSRARLPLTPAAEYLADLIRRASGRYQQDPVEVDW